MTSAETTFEDFNLPPFNHPSGDVIIRSETSKIDFRVCKAFLEFSSPLWQGMFSAPAIGDKQNETKYGFPIIPLEESKETLELLLRFVYPPSLAEAPTLGTLERGTGVLEAARKYCMEGVEKYICKELIRLFLKDEPLRLFAIFYRHRLRPEMMIAARQTLAEPLLGQEYFHELEFMSAGVYHRLHDYHQRCGRIAATLTVNFRWIQDRSYVWFQCHGGASEKLPHVLTNPPCSSCKWWLDFMHAARVPLMEKPAPATVQDCAEGAIPKACAACKNCSFKVLKDMRRFCQEFGAEIDRVVSNVELQIEI